MHNKPFKTKSLDKEREYSEEISLSLEGISHPCWQWYIERQNDFEAHMHGVCQTIYNGRTRHQNVAIFDTYHFGKMLILDGDPQSSQVDEFIYHETLVHPVMVLHPLPQRVLILGGGEGASLREVLKYKTVKRVMMVDIDEEVVNICRRYLSEWSQGAFEDERVELIFMDAKEFLKQCNQTFDIIISDLTEPFPNSPSYNLLNKTFFQLIKSRLDDSGIMVMQASRFEKINNTLYTGYYNLLCGIFPVVRCFHCYVPSFYSDWGFIIASDRFDPLTITPEEVDRRIRERISTTVNFYDGQTHQGIFSLPKYFRQEVIKDAISYSSNSVD